MISVKDIETKDFKKSAFGYSQDDVDRFLDEIIVDYEKLLKDNFDLKSKVTELNESVLNYKMIEKSLQTTLSLAEKTANETLKSAEFEKERIVNETRKQAEIYLSQAKEKADKMLSEAQEKYDSVFGDTDKKLSEMESALERLTERYKNTKKRLKLIFEAELKLLEKEAFCNLSNDFYNESEKENFEDDR